MKYAARQYRTDADGLRVFSQPEDHASERAVADRLEREWRCRLHRYPQFTAVDWYAERDGRMAGLVELKTRSHRAGHYPTVWLNVRKHLALSLGSLHYGVPAVFVVAFEDEVRWVRVADIDARGPRIGGCADFVKARTDREPVIDVPVELMNVLPPHGGEGGGSNEQPHGGERCDDDERSRSEWSDANCAATREW